MSAAGPPLEARLALAFAGARARAVLEPLLAIDAEIAAAARAGIDHAVAHAKLDWWRGEADRLAAGSPSHPQARALLAAAGSGPRYRLLAERVAAAEAALVGFAPADEAELRALLARSHGALARLAAEALAGTPQPGLEALGATAGEVHGLADALAAPGAALIAGRDAVALAGRAREAFA
ncbi:MAG: hypothetical protein JSR73_09195, partial [Proteobacteria bacterium]|nr:hypothetical protein [Pseudomonadota bacterium]